MKHLTLLFSVALLAGCSTTKGYNPSTDTERRVVDRRIIEIERQAPAIGIPVDRALSTKLKKVTLCNETGRNGDGSYTCADCTGAVGSDCVHAWCEAYFKGGDVRYMFAVPDLRDGTIAHEVHHELMVTFYGVGGHPSQSQITRLDNGQQMTIRHASVIGWRWPAIVNWALPKAWELGEPWGGSIKCGNGEEVFEDGAGI